MSSHHNTAGGCDHNIILVRDRNRGYNRTSLKVCGNCADTLGCPAVAHELIEERSLTESLVG